MAIIHYDKILVSMTERVVGVYLGNTMINYRLISLVMVMGFHQLIGSVHFLMNIFYSIWVYNSNLYLVHSGTKKTVQNTDVLMSFIVFIISSIDLIIDLRDDFDQVILLKLIPFSVC